MFNVRNCFLTRQIKMGLTNSEYILFLNTILASSCSLFVIFGLWPFQGLFPSWIFKKFPYTWTTHVQMGWFDAGCIACFVANIQALFTFDETTTGIEGYRVVFVMNAVIHGIWGVHNLHQAVRKFRNQGKDTVNELRRPYPLLFYSIVGACGSAMVRNIYASAVPMEDYSIAFIVVTWVWEWLALGFTLLDFGYFMVKEFEWAGDVASESDIKLINNEKAEHVVAE